MRKIILLALLWVTLAAIIISQLNQMGSDLYYPVVIAWLGGLVSLVLAQTIIQHTKKDIS